MKNEQAKVRLVLDVTYDLEGESPQAMAQALQRLCEHAIGNGMLTGSTTALVDQYSMQAMVVPDLLSEDAIADHMLERIESGNLDLGQIPLKLAQYGMMEPVQFASEMAERMNLSAPDAG